MRVVIRHPNFQRPGACKGTGPLLQPEAFCYTRAHHPLGVGRDHEVMLPHQAPHPLLVHRPRLHEAQIGPDLAVALERVLRLERLHAWEQSVMTLGDQGGALPAHPCHSSLLLTPT